MTLDLAPKPFGTHYTIYSDGYIWKGKKDVYRKGVYSRTIQSGWVPDRVSKAGKGVGGGYRRVTLNCGTYLVHRLVALMFIPNPENHEDVNHIDGNRANCDVSNLEWVSKSNNQKHAYAVIGRVRKCKVSDKEKLEIYNLRNNNNLPLREIADLYGINFRTVSEIARGKRFCFAEGG